MAVVLDAGALIAAERGEERFAAALRLFRRQAQPIRVPTAVVAQAWRGSGRQARLARLLPGLTLFPLDPEASKRIGELLGLSGTADVCDGSVVDVAQTGDIVVTSDPGDIERLAIAAGKRLRVVTI